MMYFFLIFAILYGLLPLILYYKLKPEGIESISPFLVVVFVASLYEFFGSIILKIKFENWYLIYKTLAFFSIMCFFKKIIAFKKRYVYFLSALFLVMVYLTFTFWKNEHFFQINAYFNVLQTLLVLLFSIVWFRKSFLELVTESLLDNPTYYFVAGLIIYYCGSVFLFLTSKFILLNDANEIQYYWLLNIVLNLVLRTLLLVGIWKAREI